MVDDLEESPVLARIAYLGYEVFHGGGVGRRVVKWREIDEWNTLGFGGGEFGPVFRGLDE